MGECILKHRRLLMIDRDLDFLSALKREVMGKCSECQIDMVTTYINGRQLMLSLMYDLVISDPLDTPGSDLMHLARVRGFPVLVLLNGADPWETLWRVKELEVPAVVPKDNFKDIVPTIERVLNRTCGPIWRRVLPGLGKWSFGALVRLAPDHMYGDIDGNPKFLY